MGTEKLTRKKQLNAPTSVENLTPVDNCGGLLYYIDIYNNGINNNKKVKLEF